LQYLITFLEGIITFISPCLLPMLPIYISYFAGGEANRAKTVKNSLGFVLGFTAVFVCMGALAGSVGSFLKEYRTFVNIVTGLVVIVFGLNYTGILKFNIFKGISNKGDVSNMGFISSILFGIVFSIGWTPCVGAFLGSALMLASQQGETLTGILMLLCALAAVISPTSPAGIAADSPLEQPALVERNVIRIPIQEPRFLLPPESIPEAAMAAPGTFTEPVKEPWAPVAESPAVEDTYFADAAFLVVVHLFNGRVTDPL